MLIEIKKEIPDGWRFYKCDASVDGLFNVWLARDKDGMAIWHTLPESVQNSIEIYVTATEKTLGEAFDVVISQTKLEYALPLIEVGS